MEKLFKQILDDQKELTEKELASLDYAKMILEFQIEANKYMFDAEIEKIFEDAIRKVKSYL